MKSGSTESPNLSMPMPDPPSIRLALLPGTFDPFTYGHLDLVERALRLFDEVEVTVAVNTSKQTLLTLEERCALIRQATVDLGGVRVASFEGLIADYARRRGATALVRGLRQPNDYAYEAPMAAANRLLAPGVETIFIPTATAYAMISSTIVRDVYRWGGDLTPFVPSVVVEALKKKSKVQS